VPHLAAGRQDHLRQKKLDALERHDQAEVDRCDAQLDEAVATFNRIVNEAAAVGSF
jgi:hypothetical protein